MDVVAEHSQSREVLSLAQAEEHEAAQSMLSITWRRFRAHRMALVGLTLLVIVVLYIIVGSFAFTERYANDLNLKEKWAAPTAAHPMGTDHVGRDVMARTIYGGQISLAISILSVLVTTILGTTFGLIAGYFGGAIDVLLMRIAEALLAIPILFLLLVLSKFLGGKIPEIDVLGREISGSVAVIILVLGIHNLDVAGASGAGKRTVTQGARIRDRSALSWRGQLANHLLAHPAKHPRTDHCFCHAWYFRRDPSRSLRELSGAGRPTADSKLGQHGSTGNGTFRQSLVVVVLSGHPYSADRAKCQFHR